MKSSRKTTREGRHRLAVVLTAAALSVSFALFLVPRGWAIPPTTGSGTLTVDNNTTKCQGATGFVQLDRPEYDVTQNGTIHLNIAPDFTICTQGNTNVGGSCTSVSACVSGTICKNTCTNGPHAGSVCSNNGDCADVGICSGTSSKTCSTGPYVGKTCNNGADCTNNTYSCSSTKTCTDGSLSGNACTNSNDCGTCALSLECDVNADSNNEIVIQGHTGVACTSIADCSGGTTCDTSSRCEGGDKDGSACTSVSDCTGGGSCQVVDLCQFSDTVSGTAGTTMLCQGGGKEGQACTSDGDCSGGTCVTVGQIDACYTTRDTSCGDAQVLYCNDNKIASIANPENSVTYVPAILETTDAQGNQLDTAAACIPPSTCRNTVGSFCCGLSQGAYGAPNSIATSLGTGGNSNFCDNSKLGFIPAGDCDSCEVFAGLPNATTIGESGNSVTIGNGTVFLNDLATLEQELPAGGKPNQLKQSDDEVYTLPSQIPDPSGSGSKGQGGGALSGQSMACGLNTFLSDCTPPFGGSSSFTAAGFGGFKLPDAGTLVCTRRSGPDAVLITGDDICQAFLYPTCVAGQTVTEVKAAADQQLGTGSNDLNCSASDLTAALDNINNQFDGCGEVIDCGAQSTPGVFTCPLPPG
jgi:hypothetical protein